MAARSFVFVCSTLGALMLLVAAELSDGSQVTRAEPVHAAASAEPASLAGAEFVQVGNGELDDLVAWGLGRFARSGLPEPTLDAVVLAEHDGCDVRHGWTSFGRDSTSVALCDGLEIRCAGFRGVEILTAEAKRCLLHELAHVWIDENVDTVRRMLFLAHTAAVSWDGPALPWHARGLEQAAEVIAWGLQIEPTVVLPSVVPTGTIEDCLRRVAGFEILTGRTPIVDCSRWPSLPAVPR